MGHTRRKFHQMHVQALILKKMYSGDLNTALKQARNFRASGDKADSFGDTPVENPTKGMLRYTFTKGDSNRIQNNMMEAGDPNRITC